ncbi:photosynthetic reaction center cytochrome PufC [Acidisphaera sp. L21]|uniref:photosynthetic reaction center cytochrome PufC n=1 Tax=Acidisphaera sp. L21 TaxID=1641851 RepID=UPI00131C9FF7|nr:photosynthetic reaction center cytochrome PufC [Acidisphaera sp. L21]
MNMGFRYGLALVGIPAAILLGLVILLRFQLPPVDTVQRGYRGVGMVENYHPADVAAFLAANKVPASLPQLPSSGPKAGAAYKNVQILGDLSVGQFTRLMVSITNWVAPQQGCGYCHNTANMADDGLYTKVVARRMIQMVQHINADYTSHVAQTGVTCYTCHRGNPVPAQVWFNDPGPPHAGGVTESNTGKNHPAGSVNDSSLPFDPFTPFLEKDSEIRVQSVMALPGSDRQSIKQTEWTYALMIHFSQALGVNCTYCHNTRSFGDWSQSTPERVVAWHGIRMVRDLNGNYLDKLQGVFPAARLGPMGDNPKVSCATCHQGVFKPLLGVSMVTTFPELKGPTPPYVAPTPAAPPASPAAPATPAPAAEPAHPL